MRSALLALLLGGCLVVRTHEEVVEPPCPTTAPELLAPARGPFALGSEAIYFVGASGLLSRVGYGAGPIYELTTDQVRAWRIVNDGHDLYWLGDDAVTGDQSRSRVVAAGRSRHDVGRDCHDREP